MSAEQIKPQPDTINVGLISPAYLADWFWLPCLEQIESEPNYNAFIPQLPRDRANVTANQYVDSVYEAMDGLDSQYIVCTSRGIETGVRYLERIEKERRMDKILGLMVISSVGPRGYELISAVSGQAYERHTPEFNEGIKRDKDGYERLDPEAAERVVVPDIEDPNLRSQAVSDLIKQRPLSNTAMENVPRFPKGLTPVAWYRGRNDKVDNLELSAEVAKQKFGVEPTDTDWGHVGPLSHTEEVTQAIIKESQNALKFRKSKGFYVVIPAYPNKNWQDDIDSVGYMNMRRKINQDYAEKPVDYNIEAFKLVQELMAPEEITFSDRIVDIGSGNGMAAAAAAELTGIEAHIIGVEPNPEAIRLNSFLSPELRRRVTILPGFGEYLPWMPDNFATMVTAHNVLFRAQDAFAMLSGIKRIAKPGAYIAISTNAKGHGIERHNREHEVAEAVAELWDEGFEIPKEPAHGRYLEDLPGLIESAGNLEIVEDAKVPEQDTRAIINRGERLDTYLDSIIFSATRITLPPSSSEDGWRRKTSDFRRLWREVVMDTVKPDIEAKITAQEEKDRRAGIIREPFFADTIKRGMVLLVNKS